MIPLSKKRKPEERRSTSSSGPDSDDNEFVESKSEETINCKQYELYKL